MAGSRLDRIGTIFSRSTGLIQSGALNWDDRPLWYDIYKAFPPKEEPRYDRPAPNIKLKNIFYPEDKVRAMFHRNNKQLGTVSLVSRSKTLTHRFIETYNKLDEQYKGEATEEQLYTEAVDILNRERNAKREVASAEEEEPVSLSVAFKEAQKQQETMNISIKDLFKN